MDALLQDPSALEKRKRLYIKEFLDLNTESFKNQRVALDGIKHGIKCLVFQELFGHSGVLAILGFVYHHFRSVNFEELQSLKEELAKCELGSTACERKNALVRSVSTSL